MKLSLKSVVGGVAAVALAGGILLGAAQSASAAAPSFEPDPGAAGTLGFYNAAGTQITSGLVSDSPFAAYYAASGGGIVAGDNKASVVYATPQDGVPTQSWTTAETWTNTQTFPAVGGYPGTLAGTTHAVVAGTATDGPFSQHITNFPNASAANPGVYQIRLYTTQNGGGGNDTYYRADIKVTGTAWAQVFPAVAIATTTTLTASPNPSTVGNTVTLTATETPAAAGSVQFKDGATNLGAAVAVNGSGVATTTTNTLTAGSHSLSAVFTPTDLTAFGASTGTFAATVNPASTSTTTTLAVSGGYLTAGSAATLTAMVTGPGSTPNGAGTVAFFDNGSSTAIAGTVTPGPTGTYVLSLPTGFAAGPHSIVAKFSPTDLTQFQVSQSAPQAFTTQAVQTGACAQPGSVCTDTQNITATIPVGTLVINTPYTASNPLDLGTLVLSPDSSTLSGQAQFANIVVTDTRSGNLPWTVQAQSSNLSDGAANPNSVINAQNVGLTNLAKTSSGPGFTGVLTFTDNPAANGVAPSDPGSLGLGGATAHTVVTTDHGLGSVNMHGLLTLIAPSSTEPGVFAGTITFTVG